MRQCFLADLAGVLEYDLREEIEAAHIRPENRYTYKLNVAMTISELKRTVVEMLSTSSRLKRSVCMRIWLFVSQRPLSRCALIAPLIV